MSPHRTFRDDHARLWNAWDVIPAWGVAFEHGDERRRVAPIPPAWYELPEPELRVLWRGAEELPPRRKGLVE